MAYRPLTVLPVAAAGLRLSAPACLALERHLPTRVRRTPKPEPVALTPLAPPLDLAAERL